MIFMNSNINFYAPSSGVEKSFSESNLVISTAGTTVWEVASIGIPLGIAKAVENQRTNFEYFTSSGLAIEVGQFNGSRWKFEKEKLELLFDSPNFRKKISDKQKSLIGKNGLENLCHGLLNAAVTKLNLGKSDYAN